MSAQAAVKIGFIGSSAPSSPHHESLKAFIPKDIDFTFIQRRAAADACTIPEDGKQAQCRSAFTFVPPLLTRRLFGSQA
jgi:hypothetical protein